MFDKRKEPQADSPPSAAETTFQVEPPIEGTRPASATRRSAAIIGASIVVKGDVSGAEDLLIEGKIEGSVTLESNDVTVGTTGNVLADVSAKTVKIDGTVRGDINGVEKVVITQSGKVEGNIVAPRVTLEDGAKFKGSIDMDPEGDVSNRAENSKGSRQNARKAPARTEPTEETKVAGAAPD